MSNRGRPVNAQEGFQGFQPVRRGRSAPTASPVSASPPPGSGDAHRSGGLSVDEAAARIATTMAEDPDSDMRFEAAMASYCPAEVLERLSEDDEETVQWAVAGNETTPPATLAMMLHARNEETGEYRFSPRVRAEAASNPRLPLAAVRAAATDSDPRVRSGVTVNPEMPEDVARLLAGDESKHVRAGVAQHPVTPEDVRDRLREDPEAVVRAWVRKDTPPAESVHD